MKKVGSSEKAKGINLAGAGAIFRRLMKHESRAMNENQVSATVIRFELNAPSP